MQKNNIVDSKIKKNKIKLLWMGDIATQTGFGKVTEEILDRLDKTGLYDICVLGLNYRGDYTELQRRYKIFPVSDSDLFGQGKAMPLIKTIFKPDVIIALNDIDCLIWLMEQRVNAIDKSRIIQYGPLDSHPNHPKALEALMQLDRFITFTEYGRNALRNQIPNMPVDVVPHGINLDHFKKLDPALIKEKKQQLFRNVKDPYVVGCVGRNQYRKEFPRLLEAFKLFAADKPNAVLFLHTSPRDNAPGFPLPELISVLGLEGKVFFPQMPGGGPIMPGHGVSIEELNMYYNMMDVMVLPSNAGGWELPLQESNQAGTPVISTNFAAMKEVCQNGRGLLTDVITEYWFVGTNLGKKGLVDINKLAQNIQFIYDDQTKNGGIISSEMVKRAQAFGQKYNWDWVGAEFHRIIQEEYSQSYKDAILDKNSGKKWQPCRVYPDFPNNDYDPNYIG